MTKIDPKKSANTVNNSIDINPELNESPLNSIVISWGRMNPPTLGHQKLVNKVKDVAARLNAKAEIYLTHTQDTDKNPLAYHDKILIAREAFGSIVHESPMKTIIEVAKYLAKTYNNLVLVVGQDRVTEFKTLLNKYNGREYNFESIDVVSAGQRDPDGEGVEGVSASKMRGFAKAGDKSKFALGLPSKLLQHSTEIYDMVRANLKLAKTLGEHVLTIQQRRRRALALRRISRKMMISRARMRNRVASNSKLLARARKKAIEIIRKKVAGPKGLNYNNLSDAEKIIIDLRVEKRKRAIGKIAARLLPRIRKAEQLRIATLRSKDKDSDKSTLNISASVNEAFELYLENSPHYHMIFNKHHKVNFDRRYKAFKHIPKHEETDADLLNAIVEAYEFNDSVSPEDIKLVESLLKKSERSGIDFDTIYDVYEEGVNNGLNPFNHVNSFVANCRFEALEDKSLTDMTPLILPDSTSSDKDTRLTDTIKRKLKTQQLRIYNEEYGAGFQATDELVNNYKKATPGEKYKSKKTVDEAFEEYLSEGVHDPSIFKAIFLAGGPGSGKSFIVGKTALSSLGMKIVNSDMFFERALTKAGMNQTPEDIYSDKGQELRSQSKLLTNKFMDLAINGRLGLVIDHTGKDYNNVIELAEKLKKMGYEVGMIFVNTRINTAQARNKNRLRTLPRKEVTTMWHAVQDNIGKFQRYFKPRMFIIDNNDGSNYEDAILNIYRKVSEWTKTTPKSSIAKAWIRAGSKIQESYFSSIKAGKKENLYEEDDTISASTMKKFETFVDRMFDKFNIDFEFTKHFGDRMNDDRNTPSIKLKELADLIKKIYNKNGNPLKNKSGAELVIKDLQSDLNMPVIVKYDPKTDEIEVVAKTIMRKKNFSTPNQIIKY